MGKTYIADTCDVTARTLGADSRVIFTGSSQLASISQQTSQEPVKGGIGSKTQFILKSDKEITLSIRDALFSKDYIEMQQGTVFKDGTAIVTNKKEGLKVVGGKVEFDKMPIDDTAVIFNSKGEKETVTVTVTGVSPDETFEATVTPEFAGDGETLTAIFKEEVSGKVLNIDADKFPENFEIEFHTIEFDKETSTISKDLYFKFFSATPDGNMEYSFENGTAIAPEIGLTCLTAPNSNKIGQVVEVDRVKV